MVPLAPLGETLAGVPSNEIRSALSFTMRMPLVPLPK
jgi:hypothetical protein